MVFAILNLICECVSAALEQVAGDSHVYFWAGFACALVAVGFSVGELLWMKQNKINIGVVDVIGFVAAGLQILSCSMQVWFAYAHKEFPIKSSLFSIIFALIAACHKMIWKSETHQFIMYCEESSHCLPLTVREKHSSKTFFKCTSCDTSLYRSGRDENSVRNFFHPRSLSLKKGKEGYMMIHREVQGSRHHLRGARHHLRTGQTYVRFPKKYQGWTDGIEELPKKEL